MPGILVELGWPDPALWPNGSRGHHMKVHRMTKAAREEANWATRYVKPLQWTHGGGMIDLHIIAHPKTSNTVDAQNLIAGLKAHFDGIADALGVNDKLFNAPTVEFVEPRHGGRVFVRVSFNS